MIGEIRMYRPIPPLRVWRMRFRGTTARWSWGCVCRICGAASSGVVGVGWPRIQTWREALTTGLEHLYRFHGCPSMRASGEPCNEYCADCGGKRWVK